VNPFRRITHKAPVTDWPEHTIALRAEIAAQLRDRGTPLLGYVLGGYVLNGLLLVGSIWACGVSRTELPLSLGLMLYSVGRLSTVVSITPGGVGVVEIAYTAVYVAVLGESAHDSVVAGVLVYRALTYLLPIITGAAAYVVWRVMQHRARRAELAGAT
jgi:putative heme transporter